MNGTKGKLPFNRAKKRQDKKKLFTKLLYCEQTKLYTIVLFIFEQLHENKIFNEKKNTDFSLLFFGYCLNFLCAFEIAEKKQYGD